MRSRRADAPLGLLGVEAPSTQTVSFEVPKPLDHRLQPGERTAINYRLRELNQQIFIYRVESLPAEDAVRRSLFELARAVNAPAAPPLVIIPAETANLAGVDTLAQELDLRVALDSRTDPKAVMAALDGRSSRLGVVADLGGWMQAGIKPVDGLAAVKDKLFHVRVADRSALGPKGRAFGLGEGAGALSDFFVSVYKAGIKPSFTIETTGATEADMMRNLQAFERVMWPVMAERVRVMLTTPAGQIRGGDRLDADMRAQIDAAAPRAAVATPRRPRKLLVTDIQMYSGHSTIPHGTLMLELMAKYTGAFEPIFSNDLNLLKYPKIKEFDAVFLNNVCGMVHNDPEVREGILRFVREGGGIGGNHAVTYANNNWPEFSDMMGGWSGAHHVEKQMLKIDDPANPLMKPFGTESFEHTDEFYIFPDLLAVFAREVARADEHRRREVRSRHGRPFLRAVHAARSGLRRRLGQGVRQGAHLLHAARPHHDHVHRQALDAAHPGGRSVHPRRSRCRCDARGESTKDELVRSGNEKVLVLRGRGGGCHHGTWPDAASAVCHPRRQSIRSKDPSRSFRRRCKRERSRRGNSSTSTWRESPPMTNAVHR